MLVSLPLQRSGEVSGSRGRGCVLGGACAPLCGMFLALLARHIFIRLPEVIFIESLSLGTARMGHFQCF